MAYEVDTNGVLREVREDAGIKFRDPETGQETLATIMDKDPYAEKHYESRRVVEVSIEAFGELMALIGYFPVNPVTDQVVYPSYPDETEDDE